MKNGSNFNCLSSDVRICSYVFNLGEREISGRALATPFPESFGKYILLTKREGRTGRMSARVLDSTDRAHTKKTEGRYSPSTVPSKLS